VAFAAAVEAGAELGLAGGTGEQAFGEGAEVEAGSPGDDREAVAGGDCLEGGAGLTAVFAGGKRLVGVGNVDEMVGQARAFFGGGFGCAKVHASIDRNRVATDDLGTEAFAQCERESGFAAAGGAEKQNG
jgi:hypothetical protein